MKTIEVRASRPYKVYIEDGILQSTGELLCAQRDRAHKPARALIVTDDIVAPLYLKTVRDSLDKAGIATSVKTIPNGEASKNGRELFSVLECAAENGLRHGDVFVALGGGVVGDLCGLAAALYLRGSDFVMLPTTLLAAVDSSVGGKTAVDLEHGKNLAGSFHQPLLVICDPTVFKTLPARQYRNGMAEIIKYGMIGAPSLLTLLEEGAEGHLEEIIAQCVAMKAEIVAHDEFDTSERRLLNFGHTLGHAVELESGLTIQHGEAVAIGMKLITAGCAAAGLCAADVPARLEALLRRYELDPDAANMKMTAERLLRYAALDKKSDGDGITLVLPQAYGQCVLKKTDFTVLSDLTRKGLAAL